MLDYQIICVCLLSCLLIPLIVGGLIETAIKKHKAKKEAFAKLVRENKQLKDKIYRLKFNAELRGLRIDD